MTQSINRRIAGNFKQTGLPASVQDATGAGFFKTFNRSGDLAVTTGTQRFYLAAASELNNVEAYVKTAPVGADATLDIIKNGSTNLKTVTISDGNTSSGDNISEIALAEGDYLTVNITQVGSSTAGADLYVNLSF